MTEDNNGLIARIARVQAKVLSVNKNAQGYNYKYATLNDVIKTIHEHSSEEELAITSDVIVKDGVFNLRTIVMHRNEEQKADCPLVGLENLLSGKKNEMQSMGAGITYARRYNLLNLFNLFAEDDDAERLTKPPPPPPKSDLTIPDNAGDFILPDGEHKGKKLSQLGFDYCMMTSGKINALKKSGKTVNAETQAVLTACLRFISDSVGKSKNA